MHSGAVSGALATLTTAVVFMAKAWWEERREARLLEPGEKANAELMALLKKDLNDRMVVDDRSLAILERHSILMEKMIDAVNGLKAQFGDIGKDVRDVKAAIHLQNGKQA